MHVDRGSTPDFRLDWGVASTDAFVGEQTSSWWAPQDPVKSLALPPGAYTFTANVSNTFNAFSESIQVREVTGSG